MYQKLRREGTLTYEKVETMFEEHQGAWSEAVFNEDAYFKYIQPLIENGANYLEMCQGSKTEQRKWWLYYRFAYLDSKYEAADTTTDRIELRAYAKGNITVTPYSHIYASCRFGQNGTLVQTRAFRNQAATLQCPIDTLNNTETYIYSASKLKDVGDLSPLKPGTVDFSKAVRLQRLKLGDSSASYSNPNLTSLTMGNNTLLQYLDARNCPALGNTVDLSACAGLEEAYFTGTTIKSVTLPNGGVLKRLHLPETITTLNIQNQTDITDLTIGSRNLLDTSESGTLNLSALTRLRLENCGSVMERSYELLQTMNAGGHIRLMGVRWNVTDGAELFEKLERMQGIDVEGYDTSKAQISGTVQAARISATALAELREKYPALTVTVPESGIYYAVFYRNYDGSLWHTEAVMPGSAAAYAVRPKRDSDATHVYTFAGWSLSQDGQTADAETTLASPITGDLTVYAIYTAVERYYTVNFYADNEKTNLLKTMSVSYNKTADFTPLPINCPPVTVDSKASALGGTVKLSVYDSVTINRLRYTDASGNIIYPESGTGFTVQTPSVTVTQAASMFGETVELSVDFGNSGMTKVIGAVYKQSGAAADSNWANEFTANGEIVSLKVPAIVFNSNSWRLRLSNAAETKTMDIPFNPKTVGITTTGASVYVKTASTVAESPAELFVDFGSSVTKVDALVYTQSNGEGVDVVPDGTTRSEVQFDGAKVTVIPANAMIQGSDWKLRLKDEDGLFTFNVPFNLKSVGASVPANRVVTINATESLWNASNRQLELLDSDSYPILYPFALKTTETNPALIYAGSENSRFTGWNPSNANITADTDCVAQFESVS